MSAERLTIEGLGFERGGHRVLDEVSFRVAAGDWVTLLGPNGAGKTTLIKLITGQLAPVTGSLLTAAVAAHRRGMPQVGLVPQEPALFDALDVTANLAAFARLHGVPARERAARVHRALEWSGLYAHAGKRVAALSGGMVRRLNIACATLHDPPLLVLDEATVGVDPQAREHIYSMLLSLQRAGTALLYSTHLFDEAERFSSRIVVLDRGRVIAAGTPGDIRAQAGLAAATLRLEVTPDAPDCALPGLTRLGNHYTGTLDDPLRELPRLFGVLAAAGIGLERVSCGTSRLDDAYFSLTGRNLRA